MRASRTQEVDNEALQILVSDCSLLQTIAGHCRHHGDVKPSFGDEIPSGWRTRA